jgi:hypothetical protein
MRAFVAAVITVILGAGARLEAQKPAAKPADTRAEKPAEKPARGPVIAPSKPVVAPGIGSRGDAGAMPTAAQSANARTISVSARQAAEQTIAALVAAMKNMPKRPPAPPESRTPRARAADGGARGQALDAPPPINYHVTWPAAPPEIGVGRRVELDWHAPSANGPVSLRWNEPQPD